MLPTKETLSLLKARILETLDGIKDQETFSVSNQKALLTKKELVATYYLYTGLNNGDVYIHVPTELYIATPIGLYIGYDPTKMRKVHQTLFAFLAKHNYLPSEFTKDLK